MMIYWEEEALNDREAIYRFLYTHNPLVADKTDEIIEQRAEALHQQSLMGLVREPLPGRILVIPEISMLLVYKVSEEDVQILRVLHQKQQFP